MRSMPSAAATSTANTGIEGMRIEALMAVVRWRPSTNSTWLANTPSVASRASIGRSRRAGSRRSWRQASSAMRGAARATRKAASTSGATSDSTALPMTWKPPKQTCATTRAAWTRQPGRGCGATSAGPRPGGAAAGGGAPAAAPAAAAAPTAPAAPASPAAFSGGPT